ncbi:MAG: hypothetical protein ACI80V_003356 [Rhodothermales bacterium]|jgi:hypothetical protein
MTKYILGALTCLIVMTATPAMAQRSSSGIALGAQFGSPSGIGLRLKSDGQSTYDFVAAWDLDDFFFVNGHILFDKPIGTDRRTTFFYGPGLFLGFRDRQAGENEAVFGFSASAGISFRSDPFEFMLRLTPRISVIPDTDATIGGGVGFYYWF